MIDAHGERAAGPIQRASDAEVAARKALAPQVEGRGPIGTAEYSTGDEAWTPTDRAVFLPTEMLGLDTELAEAAMELDRVVLEFKGVLAELRKCEADGVRAASTDPHRASRRLWCWTHQQDLDECDADDPTCNGEAVGEHADPTADAAVAGASWATAAIKAHRHDARQIIDAVDRMAKRAEQVPATAATRPDVVADGPGDRWCSNCWRDGQYHEPITMRHRRPDPDDSDQRTLVPYYAGLCKWCGDMKAKHGFLPTAELLDLHHRHVRITPTMWAKEVRTHRPSAKKSKRRKR